MSRKGDPGDSTYESVRDRYADYREENPPPRSPSALGFPVVSDATARVLGTLVGVGIGVGLLALAVWAYVAAATWAHIARSGAEVAYFLTGLFLTIAGLGAIFATINHNFRVVTQHPEHH